MPKCYSIAQFEAHLSGVSQLNNISSTSVLNLNAGAQAGYGAGLSFKIDEDRLFNLDYFSTLVTAHYAFGYQFGNGFHGIGYGGGIDARLMGVNRNLGHRFKIEYIDNSGAIVKSAEFIRIINLGLFAPKETIIKVKFQNDVSCFLAFSKFEFAGSNMFPSIPTQNTAINSSLTQKRINLQLGVIAPIRIKKENTVSNQ